MFNQRRQNLIVEESDVTTVLMAINRNRGFFSSKDVTAGNCGWEKDPSKWYVHFDASDKEWRRITSELCKFGKIYLNVNPAGTTDLYYTKD